MGLSFSDVQKIAEATAEAVYKRLHPEQCYTGHLCDNCGSKTCVDGHFIQSCSSGNPATQYYDCHTCKHHGNYDVW